MLCDVEAGPDMAIKVKENIKRISHVIRVLMITSRWWWMKSILKCDIVKFWYSLLLQHAMTSPDLFLFWRQSHVVASTRIVILRAIHQLRPTLLQQPSELLAPWNQESQTVYWAKNIPSTTAGGWCKGVQWYRNNGHLRWNSGFQWNSVFSSATARCSATILPEALSSHLTSESQRSECASEHTRTEQQTRELARFLGHLQRAVNGDMQPTQVPSYKFWGKLVKLAYHHITSWRFDTSSIDLIVWYKYATTIQQN